MKAEERTKIRNKTVHFSTGRDCTAFGGDHFEHRTGGCPFRRRGQAITVSQMQFRTPRPQRLLWLTNPIAFDMINSTSGSGDKAKSFVFSELAAVTFPAIGADVLMGG